MGCNDPIQGEKWFHEFFDEQVALRAKDMDKEFDEIIYDTTRANDDGRGGKNPAAAAARLDSFPASRVRTDSSDGGSGSSGSDGGSRSSVKMGVGSRMGAKSLPKRKTAEDTDMDGGAEMQVEIDAMYEGGYDEAGAS